MNAPLLPEILTRLPDERQVPLPLAAEGVARHVWHGRFGPILVEVAGDEVFVNGQRVEPFVAPSTPASSSAPTSAPGDAARSPKAG